MKKHSLILVLGVLLGAFLIYESAFIVSPMEQVLVVKLGEPKRVIKEPGLHWKMPFVESLIIYDKRVLALDVPPEEIIAADKNRIVVDTYTRYRISDPLKFYQAANNERRARQLLTAQISPDLRKILGKVTLTELLSKKRTQVMEMVQKEVADSARSLGVSILDIRIRRADVPQQNSMAIFNRMKTERKRFAEKLRAEGDQRAKEIVAEANRQANVIVANAQKDAAITMGEGDGEAAMIYRKTFGKNPKFYDLHRSMKAYKESMIQSEQPVTMVMDPKSSAFLHHFNGK